MGNPEYTAEETPYQRAVRLRAGGGAKVIPIAPHLPKRPPMTGRNRPKASKNDHAGSPSVATIDPEYGVTFRVLTGVDKGRLTQAIQRASDLDMQEAAALQALVDWLNYGDLAKGKNERAKVVGPLVVWLTQDELAKHARMVRSTLKLVLARLEAKGLIVVRAYDTTGLRRKDRRRDEYVLQFDRVLTLVELPRKWKEPDS